MTHQRKPIFGALALACVFLVFPLVSEGQSAATTTPSPKPQTCEAQAAQRKRDWGQTDHAWLASVFHNERSDTRQTWCSIWETHGYDRVHKTEDFGRVFFTGDGVHPTVGSIVPGSGFAGGLDLNLQRAATTLPLRFNGSIEARGSVGGFWEAGGTLNILGSSANVDDDRHIHATLTTQHRSLPKLTYFGLGDSSALADISVFGLADTNASGKIWFPVRGGFTLSANLGGVWSAPSGYHASALPSIEQVFTPQNTPALATSTAFVVSGVGIDWAHPLDPCLQCWYSTDVTLGFQLFHEATGAPYSFRRFQIEWTQAWHLFPDFPHDLGTVSVVSRLIESVTPAGNSVPFYLQPTIGGTDINGFDVVRSYPDYRFRAPNALTFQGEYTRPIYDPLDFLFFYDVGKVALDRGDLGISHMRHSFGVGFTVRAGGFTEFKFYYAWAGTEGTHTNYTGNTDNFVGENGARGVF